MFKLISDTSCDWVKDYADEHDVTLVPLYTTFDGQTYYKEQFEISYDEFYRKMTDENAFPKSSLPSIQDYVDAFMPSVEAGVPIICCCISTFFSGSYNSACSARDMILEDHPDAKISVINSLQNSASMSLFVYEAMCMRDAGYSYEEAVKKLEALRPYGRIIFTTESLDYLTKGGRLVKTAAMITSKLSLRPIIIMKGGEIGVGGFFRTRKKPRLRLLSLYVSTLKKLIQISTIMTSLLDTALIRRKLRNSVLRLKQLSKLSYLSQALNLRPVSVL